MTSKSQIIRADSDNNIGILRNVEPHEDARSIGEHPQMLSCTCALRIFPKEHEPHIPGAAHAASAYDSVYTTTQPRSQRCEISYSKAFERNGCVVCVSVANGYRKSLARRP